MNEEIITAALTQIRVAVSALKHEHSEWQKIDYTDDGNTSMFDRVSNALSRLDSAADFYAAEVGI